VRVLGAVLSVNFMMRRRVLPASHRGHPGGELTQIPRCLNAPPHSSMSIMGGRRAAAALFLALLGEAAAFYLPGVAPRKYKTGERMRVKVNTLTSDLTPLQVAYCPFMPPQPSSPCSLCVLMFGIDACLRSGQTDWQIGSQNWAQFDYYNIPFCEPRGGEKELAENLGEVLAGERTETSAYKLHTNMTRLCKVACRKRWTPKAVREFRDFAGANFRANMRLDNLPGAELVVFRDQRGEEFVSYRLGYPLAEPFGRNASNFYVNNHLRITIRYHDVNTKGTRMEKIEEPGVLIVGFELKAMSIDHKFPGKWNPNCAYNNSCTLTTCSPTRWRRP